MPLSVGDCDLFYLRDYDFPTKKTCPGSKHIKHLSYSCLALTSLNHYPDSSSESPQGYHTPLKMVSSTLEPSQLETLWSTPAPLGECPSSPPCATSAVSIFFALTVSCCPWQGPGVLRSHLA